MENSTFRAVIKSIIHEFDNEYQTVSSLQKIIKKLQTITFEESIKYRSDIMMIVSSIKNYGNEDTKLTRQQSMKICELLEESLLSDFKPRQYKDAQVLNDTNSDYNPNRLWNQNYLNSRRPPSPSENKLDLSPLKEDCKSAKSTKVKKLDHLNAENFGNKFPQVNEYRPFKPNQYYNDVIIKKFDSDDVIGEVVFALLTNLSRDVMVSTLTGYIIDYFETVYPIMELDLDKYFDITSEIRKCLENNGWRCKTVESAGGFQSEPNRQTLINNLSAIVDKYF